MNRKPLTPQEIDKVCHLYQLGLPCRAIGEEFNIAQQNINLHLAKRGIARRGRSACQRHHSCDDSFFETIDAEPKAYWLGLLAADGNVFKGEVRLHLSQKDIDHIGLFQSALKATNPVVRIDYGHPMAGISINSPKLIRDLAKWSIVPNKGAILQWPAIPQSLLPHYLRGYIDGDGCFYRHRANLGLEVVGNPPFITAAQTYLMEECRLRRTKVHVCKTVTPLVSMRYEGRQQMFRIASLLYKDATVWLERKHNIVQAYIRASSP